LSLTLAVDPIKYATEARERERESEFERERD
jgi:hypothetical protein